MSFLLQRRILRFVSFQQQQQQQKASKVGLYFQAARFFSLKATKPTHSTTTRAEISFQIDFFSLPFHTSSIHIFI